MNWESHIRHCLKRLRKSEPSLKSIYDGIFSNGSMICFEYDEAGIEHKTTFDEAYIKTRNVAFSLIERLNGARGTYIALAMENSEAWVISFWAILMSGNKPYLVNLRQPASFSKGIVETLQIKYCIDHGQNRMDLESLAYESLNSHCPHEYQFDFEDEFALATSGTSMKQKICIYSGKEIYQQILNSDYAIKHSKDIKKRYKGQVKQLAFLPFYHIFGFVATYLWFTYFGCTMVFMPDYRPATILSTVKEHGVTHIFGVPMLWHTMENQIKKEVKARGEKTEAKFEKAIKKSNKIRSKSKLLGKLFAKLAFGEIRKETLGDSVRYCISGGSYIRNSTLETMNGIGYILRVGYGASEIGITSVETSSKPAILNLNGVGKPLPSVEYQIRDNVLFVKGGSTCHKIIEDGKEIEVDEWFDTDDLAHYENGMYFIDGRKTDIIISESGENINPDLIESRFNPNFGFLNDFCVLGLGDVSDETCVMVVSLSKECKAEEFNALKEYLYKENAKMSRTYQVKAFYLTYSLLKSPDAIKPSRVQLKKKIDNGEIVLTSFKEFGLNDKDGDGGLYDEIQALFAEVLGIDPKIIKPDSHFMNDLGGSSLDYFSLLTLVASKYQIDLPYEEEPRYTVQEIVSFIEEHK